MTFDRCARLAARVLAGLGAVLAALLLTACLRFPIPGPVVAITFGLAVLALVRPADALIVLAGVLPLATVISSSLPLPMAWTQPLALSWLTGWLVRVAVGKEPARPDGPVRLPWMLLLLVVSASLAVQLAVRELFLADFAHSVWHFLTVDLPFSTTSMPSIAGAVLMGQGLVLFAGAVILGRQPRTWSAVLRMTIAGGCGIAILNVVRLLEVFLRRGGGPWHALAALALDIRLGVGFADVNAAGSFFVLTSFALLGLIWDRARRPQLWTPVVLVPLAGVWLTGSRIAVGTAAFLVGAIALWGVVARRSTLGRRLAGALTLIALAAGAVAVLSRAPERMGGYPAAVSLRVRRDMAVTAVRMMATRPVFGVGIGQFYERSADFMPAETRRDYPRENAHNNFLQIGAELGLVGLIAFVWLLGAALLRRRTPPASYAVVGLEIGMAGFLLTCLSGHPLLANGVAYSFWIALGLLAAAAPPAAAAAGEPARRPSLGRWVSVAAMLVIALSVVPRAAQERRDADLEHVGWGVTGWIADGDVKYRRVIGHATIFFPSDATWIEIPYKNGSPEPASFTLGFRGHDANEFVVTDQQWHRYTLNIPPRDPDTRSEAITIDAPGATDLRIGKLVPH